MTQTSLKEYEKSADKLIFEFSLFEKEPKQETFKEKFKKALDKFKEFSN